MSEVSFYGVRPRARSGAWPTLLSEDDKDSCQSLPERARSTVTCRLRIGEQFRIFNHKLY
jgi:hypothetical protein